MTFDIRETNYYKAYWDDVCAICEVEYGHITDAQKHELVMVLIDSEGLAQEINETIVDAIVSNGLEEA